MTKRLPKTPWDADVIRQQVKRAIESVGGKTGFEAIGPTFRDAVISKATFDLFFTASVPAPITVSREDFANTLRAMRMAAGIADDDE